MAAVGGDWIAATALAFIASVALTLVLARAAPLLDLVDHPQGRKAHAGSIPLVGGIAILLAVLGTATVAGIAPRSLHFLAALTMVAAVGVWDDASEVRPHAKCVVQIVAAAMMIRSGVELTSVGDLVGLRSIGLWIFAIPLTIFAVVGVVNSMNLIDGLDGLGGSVAFVAFAWYAAVADVSGLTMQREIAMIFCGAIGGFLVFNLPVPWRARAQAFLGDAGSLMIGFALAWFAIDLTQGPGRTFPPIAALWVLLLPLADCVSLMERRMRARRSPFLADNHHIHHYLLARGFTPGQTLAILAGLSTIFGAVGFLGWRFEVPESFLFWPFFLGFFAYHFWIRRAWMAIDAQIA